MNNYDYPEGADITSAPWNKHYQKLEQIGVNVEQSFSKNVKVWVDDYTVEKDWDDGYYFWNDYSGCDIKSAVMEQCITITEILEKIPGLYNKFCELDFSNPKEIAAFKKGFERIAFACNDWTELDLEIN